MDEQIVREIEQAEELGLMFEGALQAVTTALAVMGWADFTAWRAWCDEQGWTSGPRTEDVFRLHRAALAELSQILSR